MPPVEISYFINPEDDSSHEWSRSNLLKNQGKEKLKKKLNKIPWIRIIHTSAAGQG